MAERTTDAYSNIANLLAELREALSGSAQSDLAETHARQLKAAHPTNRKLISSLRSQGFNLKNLK